MGKDAIKIAIIGLGHIGQIHVQALLELPFFELVAACDTDMNLADILPETVAFYKNYKDMLNVGGFDVAVVATPNKTHTEISKDVLETIGDVIVEKPAAMTLYELKELEQLAQKKNRHIYYAFHAAYAPEVLFLHKCLCENQKKYGPLTGFFSRFYDPYLSTGGELSPSALGLGDCWFDSGINALSVIDKVYSVEFLTVKSRLQSVGYSKDSTIGNISVQFSFPVSNVDSSGLGVIETAWDQGVNYKCTELYFACTGWCLILNHSEQKVFSISPEGKTSCLAAFTGERLLNHYHGVFRDYFFRYQQSKMNSERSIFIHRKLYEASEI